MKKILAMLASLAVAATMVTSAFAAEFSETGSVAYDASKSDGANCIQVGTAATGGTYEFAATDVVTATVTAGEGADISTWNVALTGFNTSWSGWSAVASEAGVLTVETTIQDIMDANSITDIAEFGGFILQIWNAHDGETWDWTLEVAPAAEEEAPAPEGTIIYEGSGEVTFSKADPNTGNCVQLGVEATGGTLVFNPEDVITATITPGEGLDSSAWNVAVNGFTTAWGGWTSVSTEAGVLTVTTTVQDVMDANGITDIAEFGGFILQVWNAADADTWSWEMTITSAAEAEDEPTDEPVEDEPVEDEPSEETPVTGATAGLALAAVALAGAAVVATKKNK